MVLLSIFVSCVTATSRGPGVPHWSYSAHLAIELHVHFIKMPAPVPKPAHPVDALATDLTGKERAEPVPPQAHCLMAKIISALEQKILHVAQ